MGKHLGFSVNFSRAVLLTSFFHKFMIIIPLIWAGILPIISLVHDGIIEFHGFSLCPNRAVLFSRRVHDTRIYGTMTRRGLCPKEHHLKSESILTVSCRLHVQQSLNIRTWGTSGLLWQWFNCALRIFCSFFLMCLLFFFCISVCIFPHLVYVLASIMAESSHCFLTCSRNSLHRLVVTLTYTHLRELRKLVGQLLLLMVTKQLRYCHCCCSYC